MKGKILATIIAIILASIAAAPKSAEVLSDASGSQAKAALIKATFLSHTNDDDKDHDTGVYVKVWIEDRSRLIAHADNRDSSEDNRTEYVDGSDHQFDLDLDAPQLSKSAARNLKVQVCQRSHGSDTWTFNGRVVLYFSDRTNLAVGADGIHLNSDSACVNF